MKATRFLVLPKWRITQLDPGPSLPPRWRSHIFQASVSLVLFLLAIPVLAQTAPDLGSTSTYAIVSGTFTNTTPGTNVDGDVCYTTPPVAPPTINGTTVTPCPPQVGLDQAAARAHLDAQPCTPIGAAVALNTVSIGGGLPGVFPPGCYSSTGAMTITTGESVTLSGDGVYIFRPGGALGAGANSSVVLADDACADNVFWTPTGGTTLGANVDFIGTIFRGTAAGLSITLGDSASLDGRALAFGSTVTTDNNTIAVPDACPGSITATAIPVLSPGGVILLLSIMSLLGSIFLRHSDGPRA